MSTAIIILGIVALGAIGIGSGRRTKRMDNWTVGDRNFSRWQSWFLQAGESLTTYAFLGMAGLAFGGGVIAVFPIVYLTTSTISLYFIGPRIRDLGATRGYLTMSDMVQDRLKSRTLTVVVSLVGAIFVIPYLALQVTGLGLIVQLATGSSSAGRMSMIIGAVIVAIFVIWSGVRGIARVSVLKDAAMVLALLVVFVAVLAKVGGLHPIFHHIEQVKPDLLTMTSPSYDAVFFVSSVVITTIGAAFNTFPHLWPPLFVSRSGEVIRDNYKWLAVYQLLLFMPILSGMAAISLIPAGTGGNEVLLTVGHVVLPSWVLALIGVAGAAAALVPSAAISMGMSTLLSHNVLTMVPDRFRLWVNHAAIVVALGIALASGLAGTDLSTLLLITYGGLSQLALAVAFSLTDKIKAHTTSITVGMIVGSLVVVWLSATPASEHSWTGNWDYGLIGLGVNVLVFAVVEAIFNLAGSKAPTPDPIRNTAGAFVATAPVRSELDPTV